MSIPIKKITEKIMEENYNKNDSVYILPSWEKMNCLNLVKHNRIQIAQAWLIAECSKVLSN